MTDPIAPVAFSAEGAAAASGYGISTIRRAITAGDLIQHFPEIAGRQLDKPVILADDLRAWVLAGKVERTPR